MTRISNSAETGSDQTVPQVPLPLLCRVFLPFAGGYFLSYLFRVVNAVIAPDLAADTGVDPAQLGLLTATYLITFAAFQLPLGILLDRFGPRAVEAVLLLFAAAGTAACLSISAVAMIAGFIILGFVTETLARKGIPVLYTAVTGMTVFIGMTLPVTGPPC